MNWTNMPGACSAAEQDVISQALDLSLAEDFATDPGAAAEAALAQLVRRLNQRLPSAGRGDGFNEFNRIGFQLRFIEAERPRLLAVITQRLVAARAEKQAQEWRDEVRRRYSTEQAQRLAREQAFARGARPTPA